MSQYLDINGLAHYNGIMKPPLANLIDKGEKNIIDWEELNIDNRRCVVTGTIDNLTITSTAKWAYAWVDFILPVGDYVWSLNISNYTAEYNSCSLLIATTYQFLPVERIADKPFSTNGFIYVPFTSIPPHTAR